MPEDQESKFMSRRDFLKWGWRGALATGAVLAYDSITGGNLVGQAADKLVSAAEVIESQQKSKAEYQQDKLTIKERNVLLDEPKFKVERLNVDVEGSDSSFNPVLITFTESSEASIQTVPDLHRETVLYKSEGSTIVGPVGYVEGDYHRKEHNINPSVTLKYPGRTSVGTQLGPNEFINRFPGLSDSLNQASGGVVINSGRLEVVNKSGLERAHTSGEPYLQMVYI